MPRGLQAELKQKLPFTSREQEAYLALLRTADALQSSMESKLKEFGLTGTQYNALRILRGAGPEGLPCSEIERTRDQHDRRVIYGKITAAGLKLLRELDGPVKNHSRDLLRHIGQARLKQLIDLLELVRCENRR
jgi:hypothetical protein